MAVPGRPAPWSIRHSLQQLEASGRANLQGRNRLRQARGGNERMGAHRMLTERKPQRLRKARGHTNARAPEQKRGCKRSNINQRANPCASDLRRKTERAALSEPTTALTERRQLRTSPATTGARGRYKRATHTYAGLPTPPRRRPAGVIVLHLYSARAPQ